MTCATISGLMPSLILWGRKLWHWHILADLHTFFTTIPQLWLSTLESKKWGQSILQCNRRKTANFTANVIYKNDLYIVISKEKVFFTAWISQHIRWWYNISVSNISQPTDILFRVYNTQFTGNQWVGLSEFKSKLVRIVSSNMIWLYYDNTIPLTIDIIFKIWSLHLLATSQGTLVRCNATQLLFWKWPMIVEYRLVPIS